MHLSNSAKFHLHFVIWQSLTVVTILTLTQTCIWYLEKGQVFFFSDVCACVWVGL